MNRNHNKIVIREKCCGNMLFNCGYIFYIIFILMICCLVTNVDSGPNERQTQELLLLDALGRKPVQGLNYDDPLISMLGRSKWF